MALPRIPGLSRRPRHVLPDGLRVYAVGDIHGRLDLIEPMLTWIRDDSAARATEAEVRLVFLGDLIDRGPQSAGVIDLLIGATEGFAERHFVRGNHEQVMLDIIDGNLGLTADWLSFGGAETLQSYGVDPSLYWSDQDAFRRRLLGAVPQRHVDFIRGMVDWVRIGDYLFVHAGILPGVAIEAQDPYDLRWIRGSFLRSTADHGAMVIHGHTISPNVDYQPNRIGIDTGAFQTGHLTALGLEGTSRWTLTSRIGPA